MRWMEASDFFVDQFGAGVCSLGIREASGCGV